MKTKLPLVLLSAGLLLIQSCNKDNSMVPELSNDKKTKMQREPSTFDSDGTDYTEINIGQHGEVEISSGGGSGGGGSYYGGYIVLPLTPPAGSYFQIPGLDYGNSPNKYSTTSTRLIISTYDRLAFPTLARILDGLESKVKSDTKLMGLLKEYTHLSESEILDKLKSGQGPIVTIGTDTELRGAYSAYDPNTGKILISRSVALDANLYSYKSATAAEFYLSVCILHEFVHYGEHATQNFLSHNNRYDDPGFRFEEDYYGGAVQLNYTTKEITYKPVVK